MAIVFAVVTITFFVVHLAQGTPCGGERPLPPDVCERERAVFGYDKPLQVQYVKYLAALLVNSMPVFWLGLVLLLVFAQWLRWFPAGGITNPILCPRLDSPYCLLDFLWHLTLPALTLGLVGAASTARYQRAAMLEVVRQDYVRTARAKGLREQRVLLVHALRNALLPIITLFGLAFPFLFTGAVLIETVFAWPGMGRLAVNAIFQRDYPVVTGAALLTSAMVVLGNLIADALYAVADPRIRVRGGEGGP